MQWFYIPLVLLEECPCLDPLHWTIGPHGYHSARFLNPLLLAHTSQPDVVQSWWPREWSATELQQFPLPKLLLTAKCWSLSNYVSTSPRDSKLLIAPTTCWWSVPISLANWQESSTRFSFKFCRMSSLVLSIARNQPHESTSLRLLMGVTFYLWRHVTPQSASVNHSEGSTSTYTENLWFQILPHWLEPSLLRRPRNNANDQRGERCVVRSTWNKVQ